MRTMHSRRLQLLQLAVAAAAVAMALVAGAPVSVARAKGPDAVVAFPVSAASGVYQISGGAAASGPITFFGGSKVVYRAQFTSSSSASVSIVPISSRVITGDSYSVLGSVTFDTAVNGSIWFGTMSEGIAGGAVQISTGNSASETAFGQLTSSQRTEGVVGINGQVYIYDSMGQLFIMLSAPGTYQQPLQTLPHQMSVRSWTSAFGYVTTQFRAAGNLLLATGLMPGHSDFRWAIEVYDVATQRNATIPMRLINGTQPTLLMSLERLFSDATYLYALFVPCSNVPATGDDDSTTADMRTQFTATGGQLACAAEVVAPAEVHRIALSDIFSSQQPVITKTTISCEGLFYSVQPVVDPHSGTVYFVCYDTHAGDKVLSKFTLPDMTNQQTLCAPEYASPDGTIVYMSPQFESGRLLIGLSNYGAVPYVNAQNWIGYIQLSSVSWTAGIACPGPWYTQWYFYLGIVLIALLIVGLAVYFYRKRSRKNNSSATAPLASAPVLSAGAAYEKFGDV